MLTKSQHTISNILAAAASLFVAKNYTDVTMEQIAEASNVSKGAIYHHFASKEDLYLELMHNDLAEKRRLFRGATDSPGSCRERLRTLTAAFFALPPIKRDLLKLVRRDINLFDEPIRSNLVRAYQSALPQVAEGLIREGMRSGEIRPSDPRLLSWQFVALVEVTLTDYASKVLDDVDAKLSYVLKLFFRGIEAETQERD